MGERITFSGPWEPDNEVLQLLGMGNDMTNQEIDAMEAGPEMDALVAERVMGWNWINYERPWQTIQLLWPPDADDVPHGDDFERLPDGRWTPWNIGYSTDIAAAWQVVEKMSHAGWYFMMDGPLGDEWCFNAAFSWGADFIEAGKPSEMGQMAYGASGPSAPMAICCAALDALRHQK